MEGIFTPARDFIGHDFDQFLWGPSFGGIPFYTCQLQDHPESSPATAAEATPPSTATTEALTSAEARPKVPKPIKKLQASVDHLEMALERLCEEREGVIQSLRLRIERHNKAESEGISGVGAATGAPHFCFTGLARTQLIFPVHMIASSDAMRKDAYNDIAGMGTTAAPWDAAWRFTFISFHVPKKCPGGFLKVWFSKLGLWTFFLPATAPKKGWVC